MVLLCVVFFLVHIWSRTWVVKKSYEIGDLKKVQTALDSDLAALTVEKNTIMNSQNLEKWAARYNEKGAGLKTPSSQQVIYIKKTPTKGEI